MVDVRSFIAIYILQHGILHPVAANCYVPHANINNFRRYTTVE